MNDLLKEIFVFLFGIGFGLLISLWLLPTPAPYRAPEWTAPQKGIIKAAIIFHGGPTVINDPSVPYLYFNRDGKRCKLLTDAFWKHYKKGRG